VVAPPREDPSQSISTLAWLQDQFHLLKAQLGKVQHQTDQTQAMALDVSEKMRQQEATIADLASQASALVSLQEDMRQLKDVLARLQEEQVQARGHLEETSRQRLTEAERGRVEVTDQRRRQEDLERQVEAWLDRQSGMEDAARRYQEGLALANARAESMEQRLENLEGRASRNLEATNRIDQEISRIDAAIQGLEREDDLQAERARVALEAARRVEADVESERRDLRALTELSERTELLKVERQRLDDRLAQAEENISELRGLLGHQEQLLSVLDGRTQGYLGRLEALREEILRHRQQFVEHLLKLSSGQERLKRRQIEELEREIKELKQHAVGLTEE
jgi:chromosome segregation ATPase